MSQQRLRSGRRFLLQQRSRGKGANARNEDCVQRSRTCRNEGCVRTGRTYRNKACGQGSCRNNDYGQGVLSAKKIARGEAPRVATNIACVKGGSAPQHRLQAVEAPLGLATIPRRRGAFIETKSALRGGPFCCNGDCAPMGGGAILGRGAPVRLGGAGLPTRTSGEEP